MAASHSVSESWPLSSLFSHFPFVSNYSYVYRRMHAQYMYVPTIPQLDTRREGGSPKPKPPLSPASELFPRYPRAALRTWSGFLVVGESTEL